MFTQETIDKLEGIKFVELYNKVITSSVIPYHEVCMSAIYFLWGYNEVEARKCLYKLIQDNISEENINEFIG